MPISLSTTDAMLACVTDDWRTAAQIRNDMRDMGYSKKCVWLSAQYLDRLAARGAIERLTDADGEPYYREIQDHFCESNFARSYPTWANGAA